MKIEELQEIQTALKRLISAKKSLDKASETRYKLGFDASRARITSANARYSLNAEELKRAKANFLGKVKLID